MTNRTSLRGLLHGLQFQRIYKIDNIQTYRPIERRVIATTRPRIAPGVEAALAPETIGGCINCKNRVAIDTDPAKEIQPRREKTSSILKQCLK